MNLEPYHWLNSWARRAFYWYLRRFPLRDGKEFFYQHCHQRLAPPQGGVTLRLARGFTLHLDLADPVQRRLFFFGDYDERREADLISRVLDKGEVFWDVGANLGYFTLLAATRLKNTGQVVAFEPGPSAYACLTGNLSRNPFANILAFPVAASDQEGDALLYSMAGLPDGRANLFQPGAGQTESTPVRTVTLDGWREQQKLAEPDFIKMDVEGAELAALTGARETLTAGDPLLLVEMKEAIFQSLGTERAAIEDFLSPLGYRPAGLFRGRWQVRRTVREVSSRNVLWLKPESSRHRQKAARVPVGGL
uniref:FkbM family methyltransferase n=1 Tax=Desulfobacca acetoxidans TaxID=60893 RepID=A0A7V6A645_9BACT